MTILHNNVEFVILYLYQSFNLKDKVRIHIVEIISSIPMKKVATVMVNNSITSINKSNNRLLPQIIKKKTKKTLEINILAWDRQS